MDSTEAKATWDELDDLQQYILADAATIADSVSAFDPVSETAISGLYLIDLLRMTNGTDYTITPKGRAVYEAREAAEVEAGAVTVYGAYEQQLWKSGTLVFTRHGGSNVYRIESDNNGAYNVYLNEVISVRLDGAEILQYTPATDELTTLRARVQDLSKEVRERDDQWDIATSAIGALTVVLDWLKHKPKDMTESSVIEMIENELGIDSAAAASESEGG